jgi:hypothetical protein
MRIATRLSEVQAVDRFLAGEKHLYGAMPEFGATNFNRKGHYEHQAVWPISDDLGIVTSGHLRVVARPGSDQTTISIVFNNQCVSRVDFVPVDECENNPFRASSSNLPPRVCGPHFHGWEINREHILANEMWELPFREPLPPQVRRFSQAFPWVASSVNLVLSPEQRVFDLPAMFV